MKHSYRLLACVFLVVILLTGAALAATAGYTADKTTDPGQYCGTVNRTSEGVYTASLSGIVVDGEQYCIIVTTASSSSEISGSNILYIDQKAASGTTITFDILPKTVTEANVYLGGVFSDSSTSPVLLGRILSGKPAAPTGVKATPATGKITVSWNAVSGASKYQVARRAYVDGAWGGWTNYTATSASYADSTVVAGTKYIYRVRAYAGGVWSDYSSNVQVTAVAEAPAAPSISATAAAGKVTVKWAAVTGATKYRVFRQTKSGSTWTTQEALGYSTTTSYDDTTVVAGTQYRYRVRAYGAGGWSGYSNFATVTAAASAGKPAAPTGLAAATANASKVVELTWDAQADATSFIVYRRTYNSDTSSWGSWEQFTAATNKYTDNGAAFGTIYKYRVKAKNSYGLSDSFSADVSAKTPPATPTISSCVATTGKVTIKWGAEYGATRYQVFRREKVGTGWGAMTRLVTTTELTYVDTTAVAGKTYQYLVKSYNGGYSGYSAGKTVTAK